jgi:sugar lactone lactonase YvrE
LVAELLTSLPSQGLVWVVAGLIWFFHPEFSMEWFGHVARVHDDIGHHMTSHARMEKLYTETGGPEHAITALMWLPSHVKAGTLLFGGTIVFGGGGGRLHQWRPRSKDIVSFWNATEDLGPTQLTALALEPGTDNVIACDKAGRRLLRIERHNGRVLQTTVVASEYRGGGLRGPQDLAFRPGTSDLYFTDCDGHHPGFPGSGSGGGGGGAVYMIRALSMGTDPAQQQQPVVVVTVDSVSRPTGLAFSADGRRLYVANAAHGDLHWKVFPLGPLPDDFAARRASEDPAEEAARAEAKAEARAAEARAAEAAAGGDDGFFLLPTGEDTNAPFAMEGGHLWSGTLSSVSAEQVDGIRTAMVRRKADRSKGAAAEEVVAAAADAAAAGAVGGAAADAFFPGTPGGLAVDEGGHVFATG